MHLVLWMTGRMRNEITYSKEIFVCILAMSVAMLMSMNVMAAESKDVYYYEEADPELEIEYADGGTSILRSGGPYKFD